MKNIKIEDFVIGQKIRYIPDNDIGIIIMIKKPDSIYVDWERDGKLFIYLSTFEKGDAEIVHDQLFWDCKII